MTGINKILNQLKENDLDAALISSVGNVKYLSSFFNFYGHEREGFVLIVRKNKKAYLLTDLRYAEAARKQNGLEVLTLTAENRLKKILEDKKLKSLGVEENDLTVSEYKSLKKSVKKIKGLSLSDLRGIKQMQEIEKIKKACKIADETLNQIQSELKAGVSEFQIATHIEAKIKAKEADISFEPLVAFGSNAAVPHHFSGKTKLRSNDLILLDFGAKFEGYCSDMTRTLFLGKGIPELKNVYNVVLNSQQKAIEYIQDKLKKGEKVFADKVDKIAREYIEKAGYPPIPHSLGHGIGLEVHEYPTLSPKINTELLRGMVFSIEPGIYLEGKGGVRIEDLAVITDKGLEILTNSPKNHL